MGFASGTQATQVLNVEKPDYEFDSSDNSALSRGLKASISHAKTYTHNPDVWPSVITENVNITLPSTCSYIHLLVFIHWLTLSFIILPLGYLFHTTSGSVAF